MFTLGVPEMAVIFILALVLFGPKKLPELGRTIGKAMTEFRRASNDLKATFEREMHTLERENLSIKETTGKMAREIADATYESVPPQSMWNPLEDVMKEELNFDGTPAIETATNAGEGQPALEAPAPVSASEVSGAESTEPATVESVPTVIKAGIEGTIPRGSAPEETPTTT
jgi:TatA/E family protein of Tat protein translocase